MRLLLIGASNLVIKQGLTSYLETYLSKVAGAGPTTIDNLSIPSAMNMCGLSYLLQLDPDIDYDHIIVEFAVTDYPVFAENPKLCQISFDLLLLELQNRYPNCPKSVLLLGRRENAHHELQIEIHRYMKDAAVRRGFHVIDIDALIKSFVAPMDGDGKLFRSIYLDGVHYRPPVVTNYVASVCALHIVSNRRTTVAALDNSSPAYRMGTLSFSSSTDKVGSLKQFKSSHRQYNSTARQLKQGEELVLDVPGLPCGMTFIATTDVTSLMIDVNGQRSILHTLHHDIAPRGRLKFLVRHNPFFWMDYSDLSGSIPQKSQIRLRPIGPGDSDWDSSIIRHSFGMIETLPDNNNAHVCLIGLDYFHANSS